MIAGRRTHMPVRVDTAVRDALQGAMDDRCPGCGGHLAGHSVKQIGITVARRETSDRVRAVIESFNSQAWEDVATYQEFEGAYNAIEVYAVRCPAGKNAAILLRNPAELFDSTSVLSSQVVADDSWARLTNVAGKSDWLEYAFTRAEV